MTRHRTRIASYTLAAALSVTLWWMAWTAFEAIPR